MDKNAILKSSYYLLKAAFFATILLALAFAAFLLHWNFYPESYDSLGLMNNCDGTLSFYWDSLGTAKPDLLVKNLPANFANFEGVKLLLALLAWAFIFYQLGKMLESIKAKETFHSKNVESFRRIAFIVLFLLFIEIFQLKWEDGSTSFVFGFDLASLLTAAFFFVLAEVFKEGNQLEEEQKLTI